MRVVMEEGGQGREGGYRGRRAGKRGWLWRKEGKEIGGYGERKKRGGGGKNEERGYGGRGAKMTMILSPTFYC